MNKKIAKLKILLRQNWLAFSIFFLWFIIHYFVFLIATSDPLEALQYTFYFKEDDYGYSHFYPIMSGFLIFGLILTLITVELSRKYHPEQTALALAQNMKNHTIIIGFSHLGQRIREHLIKLNEPYVIIEDDYSLINEILEDEEPVLPKKPHTAEVLNNASIQSAKLVITTENDLETLVVATNLIRDVNRTCKIVCRCFNDSLAKVLEKNFNCQTISTSKYASEYIMTEIERRKVKQVLILGCNNIARRLMDIFKSQNIDYKVLEKDKEKVIDLIDEEPITIGDSKDKDLLEQVGAKTTDLAIILIEEVEEVLLVADALRDLNESCYLICRFFHEEVAEILEKPPFNALVVSTSQHTLQKLIDKGVFGNIKS